MIGQGTGKIIFEFPAFLMFEFKLAFLSICDIKLWFKFPAVQLPQSKVKKAGILK